MSAYSVLSFSASAFNARRPTIAQTYSAGSAPHYKNTAIVEQNDALFRQLLHTNRAHISL